MFGDKTHVTFNIHKIQCLMLKPKTKGMLELMYFYHVKIITSLTALYGRFFPCLSAQLSPYTYKKMSYELKY